MKIKVVEQRAKIINIKDPTLKIEKCARTCYQSFDKESEGSDLKLCRHLIQRGHMAMFEHHRVYFKSININVPDIELEDLEFVDIIEDTTYETLMSMNLRTLLEWLNKDKLSAFASSVIQSCESLLPLIALLDIKVDGKEQTNKIIEVPESEVPLKYRYITFDILTNRGITHELVRHRKGSFAQESTRYCAYRDEFKVVMDEPVSDDPSKYVTNDFIQQHIFQSVLSAISDYVELLESGVSPQIARGILPNVTAAQIMMTMRYDWWEYFLALRETEAAHPTVRALSVMIRGELNELT